MPDVKDAAGLLEEVRKTCYSNGRPPDYAKVEKLIYRNRDVLRALSITAISEIHTLGMNSQNPDPDILVKKLEKAHKSGYKRYSMVIGRIRRAMAAAEREKKRIGESFERFRSPNYDYSDRSFEEAIINFTHRVDERTAYLPSVDSVDTERQLFDLYVEAITQTHRW